MRFKLFALSGLALSIAVLTPLSAQTAADSSVLDTLGAQTDLTAFAKIAAQPGAGDLLNGAAVTVFVPTNDALAKLPDGAAVQASPDAAKAFVAGHTVTSGVSDDALKTASALTTADGKSLSVKYDAASNTFELNGSVKVVRAIAAKNGTILVIDGVLTGK